MVNTLIGIFLVACFVKNGFVGESDNFLEVPWNKFSLIIYSGASLFKLFSIFLCKRRHHLTANGRQASVYG